MNNIIKRKWNQNSMVIIEDLQGMAFQAESGGHTFQISGIDGEGNAVALSGTPAGVMLRTDGQDVALTCSVSGGVVSATLPANAYSVPGRFGLTIFLTSDGQKTAIYAAVGTVSKTSSGTVAPPAGSDVVDLVNAIATAVATIPASYTDLMASVAPTYSSSGLYAVGSYAWYNGKLYRCTTAITSGETWTSGHWTLANLGSDLVDLKSALYSEFDFYLKASNPSIYSKNLQTEPNSYVSRGNGQLITEQTGNTTVWKQKLKTGYSTLTFFGLRSIAFYKADGTTFNGGDPGNDGQIDVITIPEDSVFVSYSWKEAFDNTFWGGYGTLTEEPVYQIGILTEYDEKIQETFKELQSGSMLYVNGDFKNGLIGSDGIFQSNNSYVVSAFVECKQGDIVSLKDDNTIIRCAEYNSSKVKTNYVTNVNNYTVLGNGYIRIVAEISAGNPYIVIDRKSIVFPLINKTYSNTKFNDGVLSDTNRYKNISMQITNGYLNATGGGQIARIVTNLKKTYARFKVNPKVYTNANAGCLVGLCKSSQATNVFADGVGLYFSAGSTANTIQSSKYASRDSLGTYINQDYDVHVFTDNSIVSFYCIGENGDELYYKTDMQLTDSESYDLFIISANEARGTNGIEIKEICLPYGFDFESASKSVMWNSTTTSNFRIYFPENYDNTEKHNVVICFHGNGTSEASWSDNANMTKVQQALVDAGFVVVTSTYKNSNSTWGNKYSIQAYFNTIDYVLKNFNIGNIGFYGNSMGGIESLNAILAKRYEVKCWCGTSPTYDLSNNHDTELFNSVINNAYGCTDETYDAKTNGCDPSKAKNYLFGRIPMLVIASSDDAAVNQDYNGFKLCDDMSPVADVTKVVTTGGHSFDVSAYTDQITEFYEDYLK